MKESSFLDTRDAVIESIKKIPVLQKFEDQELATLMEMSKIRKYKAGECIVQEGRSDTWIYFLILGNVSITKKGKKVTELTRKGEVFGEMGAIDSSRRSASAFAVTDTVCLATDIFYLEKLSGSDKAAFGYVLYRLLAEILSHRLRQTTDELMKVKGRINLKFW
jgi:CRP-like cAMP-binding protein